MIKHIILAFSLVCLAGCKTTESIGEPPELPALPDEVKAPCPGLPLLTDRSIGLIASEDASASYQYARCQAKHSGATSAYEAARTARAKYLADRKAAEEAAKKKK